MDFDAVFREHHPALYRYLYRLTGDEDVSEELAQEAFVRLLDNQVPEEKAESWLFTVATNLVRDRSRTRNRRLRLLEAEDYRPEEPERPDEVTERRERIRAARAALEQLSERDRKLLLLREEGFQYAEIAEIVGVATSSVGTLLARAMRRFEEACGPRPPGGPGDAAGPPGSRAAPESHDQTREDEPSD